MSDILKRIIAAKNNADSPFFKDREGRIQELTASQGEVFTGYYQADDDTYYTEKDWLEHQRQLEQERLAEEEYQAEQKRIAAQKAELERKKQLLEKQQKKEAERANKKSILSTKVILIGVIAVSGIVLATIIFWPNDTQTLATTPTSTVTTDTKETQPTKSLFGNAIITGSDVRMRAQPNLKGKIVTFFPTEGERVLMVQPTNDTLSWARVRRENGTEGWVFGEYVKSMVDNP
jgi:Bacterial SH3 domain